METNVLAAKRSFILILLFVLTLSSYLSAQSYEDCSFYYSIRTEDKSGIKIQPETYRVYYNNMDINPYLSRSPKKKKLAEKGETYTLFEKNQSLYMTHKLGTEANTLKIASLTPQDTAEIDDEYDYPMMLFPFGEHSVLKGIEKVSVFGQTIDAYVIKFIQDTDNYTFLYLHKENLLPVKYEIIEANTAKDMIKSKIVVQIEKADGLYINGLAEFAVMGDVYASGTVPAVQ